MATLQNKTALVTGASRELGARRHSRLLGIPDRCCFQSRRSIRWHSSKRHSSRPPGPIKPGVVLLTS
jgi:hypothetical protein